MGGVFDERFNAIQNDEQEQVEEEAFAPQVHRDVISLLRLGRIEDSFELYGHSFVMRTLNIEEEIAVEELLAAKFASSLNEKASKTAYVSASLSLVDGEPLTRSLGMSESNDLSRAFDRVKKWYRPVIDKLFERYLLLEARQLEALSELEKKDGTGLSMSVASSDSLTTKASSQGDST